MTASLQTALRWFRRILCVFGGAVTGAVVVFAYSVIFHGPRGPAPDGFIATAFPIGSIIGALFGAWIIFRSERVLRASDSRSSSPS